MSVVTQSIHRLRYSSPLAFQGRSFNSADLTQRHRKRGIHVVRTSHCRLPAIVDLLMTSYFCCYHILQELVTEQEI